MCRVKTCARTDLVDHDLCLRHLQIFEDSWDYRQCRYVKEWLSNYVDMYEDIDNPDPVMLDTGHE